jgi:hypothetical protein
LLRRSAPRNDKRAVIRRTGLQVFPLPFYCFHRSDGRICEMNPLLLMFSAALVAAQFMLPRRLAFLPLLIAACHTPYHVALLGQFTAVRLVLIAGIARALMSGLQRWTPTNRLDLLMAIWSGVALLSAVGHETGNPFQYRAGLVLNVFGTYFYARAFIRSPADFTTFIRLLAVVLVPLAGMLAIEVITGSNAYHGLGSRLENALVRADRTRAMGPFGTPILAGTMGAVALPLLVSLWRSHPLTAKAGIASSLVIIVASASSGPIGTLLIGGGALLLWRWRQWLTQIQIAAVVLIFVVQLFRERSVWYLISLIDFVGGSTGYHRSQLLDSTINHLNEWWLWGTDFTRHWMPYGLPANPDHCDLTSYYVHLGVIGGVPLLLTLLVIIWTAFTSLGARIRVVRKAKQPNEFLLWCVGCALFAHTLTFFTISYFDQLYVFFYAVIAAITPLISARISVRAQQPKTREEEIPRGYIFPAFER